ncbi:asparaginase [Streptomyces sp. JV176]|uniref:asparaginase n=1 Tax=Streptomyces sp. JV176 TaxID=858630 RepID=UPI002E7A2347|nr:asparaginase [Streptomyces sp. JV176]MEE1801961.1 asparaginase [Streptomyces sp. JV176]
MQLRLIGTGGTIASRSTPTGRVASVTVKELLETARAFPVPECAEVTCVEMGLRASFSLGLPDLAALAGAVGESLRDGADAVVITHGTDSMEETAFALSLVHADDRPIVLTGAQRPADDPAADGPRNLATALTWAAHPAARGHGVSAVFDGAVWPAIGLRKTDTLAPAAFGVPGRGPVARVDDGRVRLIGRPPRPAPLISADDLGRLPRVDIVPLYVGCDTALLDAAVAAGARGVVLCAFGAGNAPPDVTEAVARLVADGVAVAVASRVPAGATSAAYGAGGGADLLRAGAVFAADLSPWHLRLLLAAALHRAEGRGPEGAAVVIRDWLADAGHHDAAHPWSGHHDAAHPGG